MAHLLSTYVTLGLPATWGTLYVLGKALDFYERIEARRRLKRERLGKG